MSQQPPQHPNSGTEGSKQPTDSNDPAGPTGGGHTGGAPSQSDYDATQSFGQDSGGRPNSGDQPTQAFGQDPTQAFGQQPTQALGGHGAGSPAGAPHQPGSPYGGQAGQYPAQGQVPGGYGQQNQYGQQQGGYPQQGGGPQGAYGQHGAYPQEGGQAHQGGYPHQGGQGGPGGYPPAGGYGGPGQGGEEPKRRSPVPVIIGVVVALLVIGGLVFAGISLFGGDDDSAADPTETVPAPTSPAEPDDEGGPDAPDTTAATPDEDETGQTGEDPDAAPPSGQLYDTLTEYASAVEGEQASWQIDEPGWANYDVSGVDPVEAYIATFTSDEDDELEMWAVRFNDPQEAAEYGESIVEDRGEADESGDVWAIENDDDVEDDLEYGVFHLWQDGGDVEVLWWDDMGVVRHVSGPAEVTWDFYMYLPL